MLHWYRDSEEVDLLHDRRVQWIASSWPELDRRVGEQVVALEVQLRLGEAHELLISEGTLDYRLAGRTSRLILIEGRLVLLTRVLLLHQLLPLSGEHLLQLLLLLHLLEPLIGQLAQFTIGVVSLELRQWRLAQRERRVLVEVCR